MLKYCNRGTLFMFHIPGCYIDMTFYRVELGATFLPRCYSVILECEALNVGRGSVTLGLVSKRQLSGLLAVTPVTHPIMAAPLVCPDGAQFIALQKANLKRSLQTAFLWEGRLCSYCAVSEEKHGLTCN